MKQEPRDRSARCPVEDAALWYFWHLRSESSRRASTPRAPESHSRPLHKPTSTRPSDVSPGFAHSQQEQDTELLGVLVAVGPGSAAVDALVRCVPAAAVRQGVGAGWACLDGRWAGAAEALGGQHLPSSSRRRGCFLCPLHCFAFEYSIPSLKSTWRQLNGTCGFHLPAVHSTGASAAVRAERTRVSVRSARRGFPQPRTQPTRLQEERVAGRRRGRHGLQEQRVTCFRRSDGD